MRCPHGTFQGGIDGLGTSGSENNLDRFTPHDASDSLLGVLQDRALSLARLMDGGGVSHAGKGLDVDLPDRFGHRTRGLIVEIDAHRCPRTSGT